MFSPKLLCFSYTFSRLFVDQMWLLISGVHTPQFHKTLRLSLDTWRQAWSIHFESDGHVQIQLVFHQKLKEFMVFRAHDLDAIHVLVQHVCIDMVHVDITTPETMPYSPHWSSRTSLRSRGMQSQNQSPKHLSIHHWTPCDRPITNEILRKFLLITLLKHTLF